MVLDSCYQFVGEDFLVTIHGPLSPKVPLEGGTAGDQRSGGADDSGRLHPTSPFGLTSAIVSSVARRKAQMVADIAGEVGLLEQRVMAEAGGDHPNCRKCQKEMIMQARAAASPS